MPANSKSRKRAASVAHRTASAGASNKTAREAESGKTAPKNDTPEKSGASADKWSERIRVAVVGGGIAGLTAAFRLAERGFEVKVFEERRYLGGKLGAHKARICSFFVPDPAAKKLARDSSITTTNPAAYSEFAAKTAFDPYLPRAVHAASADFSHQARILFERSPRSSPVRPRKEEGCGTVDPKYLRSTRNVTISKCEAESTGAEVAWRLVVPAKATKGRPAAGSGNATYRRPLPNPEAYAFEVRLYRAIAQSESSGRKGSRKTGCIVEVGDSVMHEHCYHLYMNWYRNFWRLMENIGLDRLRDFSQHQSISHLFAGHSPIQTRLRELRNVASIEDLAANIRSGVASVPNLFLWLYSGIDLVTQSMNPGRYLDQVSVHGLLRSRWYSTDESIALHELLLSKAFSVHTYLTSATAYRRYLEFSLAAPTPALWVLNKDTYEGIFKPFELALKHTGNCEILRGYGVSGLAIDRSTRCVKGLYTRSTSTLNLLDKTCDPPKTSPSDESTLHSFKPDYVILAVPPKALADLVGPCRELVPGLSQIRTLQSGSIAVLDLYLNKQPDFDMPDSHVLLRDSPLGLTFVDNSLIRRPADSAESDRDKEPPLPNLSIAVTNYAQIEGMDSDEAVRVIITELRRYLPFEEDDIDFAKLRLQFNEKEPLFINEVGSESARPTTRTEVPNLFLAGDFCENQIGIVCVESAVTSGLLAARAVQARARRDRPYALTSDSDELSPIEVLTPDTLPTVNVHGLKQMLSPFVPTARGWALADELSRYPERAFTATEHRRFVDATAAAPGQWASDLVKFAAEAAQWLVEAPYARDRRRRRPRG